MIRLLEIKNKTLKKHQRKKKKKNKQPRVSVRGYLKLYNKIWLLIIYKTHTNYIVVTLLTPPQPRSKNFYCFKSFASTKCVIRGLRILEFPIRVCRE